MTLSDDELAEDEEEILVYVEFEGFLDGNAFSDEKLQLDMIGIDTEHPLMQINGRFYEGTYEDAVGTYMFFITQEKPTLEDPVFDTPATLKYVDKTRKVLKMQRVFAKPRTEVLGDSEDSRCIPNLSTLAQAGVPPKYQEEALNFWKTMREDRMGALHSYLEKQRIREEKKSKGIELDSESDEDNPFVGYKQKESATKTSDSKEESRKDDPSRPRNTDPPLCTNGKEISEGNGDPDEVACAEVERLAITESVPSSSKKNTAADPVESSKSKSTSTRKKKATVVHDVRRKTGKRKRVPLKRESSPPSVANEENRELDQTEKADKMEAEKDDATIETELIQESDSKDTVSDLSAGTTTKQQKREAKMREISERLKRIAEEYKSNRAD